MNIITKIENKIKKQEKIPDSIHRIDDILVSNSHLLEENEIVELRKEKIRLEKDLIKSNLCFKKRFNDFIYSAEEIESAPRTEWLIENVIPSRTIGVFFGASGSGKSTFMLYSLENILRNNQDTYIIYIDGDMSVNKIAELGISTLIREFGERFIYAGKTNDNFSENAQTFLKEILQLQVDYPNRKYVVFEDSLTLITPRKRGFIDVESLYKYEKQIRQKGTVLVVHHLNKQGVFSDSSQIENFADYTYLVERNEFTSSLLLHPQKASRYAIDEKAYKILDRKIIEEIDFKMANISSSESAFVNIILDLLADGEMNQTEIMKYLKQISFFSKYSIGEKKVLSWLEKWSKNGKWSCEQRVNEKNAKFYYLQTEKLAELPNNNKIGSQNG
jgi:energy-coupling factor transporter ATP-binding protein EcfA2